MTAYALPEDFWITTAPYIIGLILCYVIGIVVGVVAVKVERRK